jgi:hypothetical protein
MKTIPELVAQLTAATDRAARAETKVEFLSRQISDLRRQVAETGTEPAGIALEQVNVPEESEPEAVADTVDPDHEFFADDVVDEASPEPERHGGLPAGSSSLEGIWDDDTDRASENGPSSSRRDHARDIAAPPRRRWWQRRRA